VTLNVLPARGQVNILKMTAFWDIALRSLIAVARRFRDAYCFHHRGGDNGGARLLSDGILNETTRRYIPILAVRT
jgi:hypothetical protein